MMRTALANIGFKRTILPAKLKMIAALIARLSSRIQFKVGLLRAGGPHKWAKKQTCGQRCFSRSSSPCLTIARRVGPDSLSPIRAQNVLLPVLKLKRVADELALGDEAQTCSMNTR